MMSEEDRRIFDEFTNRVRERFSDARVWAFGSRARGEAYRILKARYHLKKLTVGYVALRGRLVSKTTESLRRFCSISNNSNLAPCPRVLSSTIS